MKIEKRHVAIHNANGAITSFTRRGKNNSDTYSLIDNLSYQYDGDKVISISDAMTDLSYNGAFEYADKHNHTAMGTPDFTYNSAGMLTSDLDKLATSIRYNNIALVDSIVFQNGAKVNYTYGMNGEKLKVVHSTATATASTASASVIGPVRPTFPDLTTSTTEYIGGNVEMESETMLLGKIYKYYFGDGYVQFYPGRSTVPKFYYYSKDHLGGVHSVVTKNSSGVISEVQQTHYYPFGGIIADISSNTSVQNKLYNGKELDKSNNLWWYDYGARQYDPTAPRFTTPDPLAEKYYSINSLSYCGNNPINRIDPTGMDWYQNEDKTAAFWQEGSDESVSVGDVTYTNVGSSYTIDYSWGSVDFEQNNISNIDEYTNYSCSDGNVDFLSSFFSDASTLTSEFARVGYNMDPVTGGYWEGANGNTCNISLLQKQESGKFVRGVQGYRNSERYAYNKFQRINNLGKGLGAIAIGESLYQYGVQRNEKNAWNIVDNVFSAIYPIFNTVGSVFLAPFIMEQETFNQTNNMQ